MINLHSQICPMSTVAVVLGFMIGIGPDLVDKSNHAAINGTLNYTFELAVDEGSKRISLETVPHLVLISSKVQSTN